MDVIAFPRAAYQALLNSSSLHPAEKIWLSQLGICACGAVIDTRPIWLEGAATCARDTRAPSQLEEIIPRAICEACRQVCA